MSCVNVGYHCTFYYGGRFVSSGIQSLSNYRKWLCDVLTCIGVTVNPVQRRSYQLLNALADAYTVGFDFSRTWGFPYDD